MQYCASAYQCQVIVPGGQSARNQADPRAPEEGERRRPADGDERRKQRKEVETRMHIGNGGCIAGEKNDIWENDTLNTRPHGRNASRAARSVLPPRRGTLQQRWSQRHCTRAGSENRACIAGGRLFLRNDTFTRRAAFKAAATHKGTGKTWGDRAKRHLHHLYNDGRTHRRDACIRSTPVKSSRGRL